MALPGPSGTEWALELLLWAAGAALVGELVRGLASRWVASWRALDGVERALLDLYLGGAFMFLLAALPIGAFVWPTLLGVPVGAAVLTLAGAFRGRRRAGAPPEPDRPGAWFPRPAVLVALLAALGLLVFELAIAESVATGNTFDSSLLTTWVALLLEHGSIPLSYAPYASVGVLYPQGTTVWLGWAQGLFGLPPARTSLLVTPLFLALAPLGAFAFARRAFGADSAAAGAAVFVAVVGSWTRVLVGGSNDFVLAFPLVLLLAGQAIAWAEPSRLRTPDVIAFGLLLGYSAALNPVGAEWFLPSLLVLGLLGTPRAGREIARWLARWAGIVAASAVALIPTLYVLGLGWSSPSLTPGTAAAPSGTAVGIGAAGFVGGIDPYLFRPSDVWFSPIPLLRAELAILLTVGLGILVLGDRIPGVGAYVRRFRRFVAVGIAVLIGLLAVLWAASTGWGPAVRFAEVTNGQELSIWLFTIYTLVAALPFLLLLERWRLARPSPVPTGGRTRRASRTTAAVAPGAALSLVLVIAIATPGVVLSGTSLPPVLDRLYGDFGNVSADDFALLSYAGAHLPSGARVLVAPGSAGLFLPGYDAHAVLLYPMVPNWMWINASYTLLVRELTNGTLDAAGDGALAALDVQYLIVTGANTVLWPPFSPAPLLAAPSEFPVEFHAGDAYLFARVTPPAAAAQTNSSSTLS